ncbi:MAG TPA: sigma-70 family RNA polymerase sigma factor [Casimicrobiaceae bacterium]|nr:sigma-70 family RNA polymerase sigma factor [Casimicrobiaceae bacterium]
MPDHARFERLVMPHLNAGYNLARWLARDADDAADVVQDACLRAMRYVDSMNRSDARSWFLTIVRHAFYDWCGRNRPAELVRDDEAIAATPDRSAVDPEQAAVRRSDAKVLAEALAGLPLVFREVLILREMEELSYKEIARVVDAPIGTVMSRLARARAMLQGSPQLRMISEAGR